VYVFFIYPMRATCHIYFIFLDLITLIFGEEYTLWSLSWCIFLYSPVASPLLRKTFSSEPYSKKNMIIIQWEILDRPFNFYWLLMADCELVLFRGLNV
jgi:hypothetical protein